LRIAAYTFDGGSLVRQAVLRAQQVSLPVAEIFGIRFPGFQG
jgi:hypothetical protein